jgi:hypothetical protein
LKPPIIIRRGPRGFGFTVHTIRVYYGDTDFYTMHHLVMVSTVCDLRFSRQWKCGLWPLPFSATQKLEAVSSSETLIIEFL